MRTVSRNSKSTPGMSKRQPLNNLLPFSKGGSLAAARKRPGGSNAGKYKGVSHFCGPSGGAPKGSYPVNSCGRVSAAKSYARHAPNPSGIRACAERAGKRLGCGGGGKKRKGGKLLRKRTRFSKIGDNTMSD